MSFLDEARSLTSTGGRICTTCRALGDMDAKLAAEVRRAIADPDISDGAVAAALKARGVTLAASSIGNHRRAGHDDRG